MYLKSAKLLHAEGVTISTDVITYNPFETEQDLQKTLDVLADLPKPFNLDVNKLYILKGTEIDTIVREQKPVAQVPEQVFDFRLTMKIIKWICFREFFREVFV